MTTTGTIGNRPFLFLTGNEILVTGFLGSPMDSGTGTVEILSDMWMSHTRKQLIETNSFTNYHTGGSSGEGKSLVTFGKPERFPLTGTYVCDEKSCNHLSNLNIIRTPRSHWVTFIVEKHVGSDGGCEYPRDKVPL